jgi:hypothetical protein
MLLLTDVFTLCLHLVGPTKGSSRRRWLILVNARRAGWVGAQVKQRWDAGDVLVRTGMQVSCSTCPSASSLTAP